MKPPTHHTSKLWKTAGYVTLHCLLGCTIGEVIGLSIGVSLQLAPWLTMTIATILAFITGMLLAVASVVRLQHVSYTVGIKIVWLGELISIAAMELAMNTTDYLVGGVTATSILEPIFWIGLAAALPAGYLAALPVNYWLIRKHLKKCH